MPSAWEEALAAQYEQSAVLKKDAIEAAFAQARAGHSGERIKQKPADPPSDVYYTVSELPGSLAYLHRLIEQGLGDYYNYTSGTCGIVPNVADINREPKLREVELILFHYSLPQEEQQTDGE